MGKDNQVGTFGRIEPGIQHGRTGELNGHSWAVDLIVHIDYTYQNRMYDEHRMVRHGYATDVPFIEIPWDTRYHRETLRY
jgi:hypothetical protein